MGNEENKAIYRRFIQEAFNQGQLDLLDELLADAYFNHDAPPGTPRGPEGMKQIITLYRAAFPDLELTIHEQVAEGDMVCTLTTMRGTHHGALFGIEATGRAISMTGLMMDRIVDGRLVESWVKNDLLGLMNQLTATPS